MVSLPLSLWHVCNPGDNRAEQNNTVNNLKTLNEQLMKSHGFECTLLCVCMYATVLEHSQTDRHSIHECYMWW